MVCCSILQLIPNYYLIERLYICRAERNDAIKEKYERIEKDKNFAVNAYKKYLRQGLYISEVFDDEKA